MSIFAFGYPMSHTGETALFVSGNVSGSQRTLAGHSMIVHTELFTQLWQFRWPCAMLGKW